MLLEEFHRAGIVLDLSKTRFVDVQTIYHKMEPRNLSAAYKYYCGQDLEAAHSANADTRATLEVLKAQLDKYPELTNDVKALSEFSCHNRNVDFAGRLIYNDANKEVINFGKYKGQLAEDVLRRDPGYYSWVQQGDFQQNTKDAFATIRLRIDAARRTK